MDGHHQCSSNGSSSSSSGFLCRQSSSKWIPTADQIRILRELYYINGVRSPTAEQIQRISARLRQYGEIEGKNVFYWFQNHKARERQKKKLTMDHINNSTITTTTNNNDSTCITQYDADDDDNNNKKLTTNCTVHVPYGLSAASSGLYDVGNGYGDGAPVFMDRSIRESCFSAGGGGDGSAVVESNMESWVGKEPAAMPWVYHYIKEEGAAATREIETLPLFPTHSQDQQEDQEEDQEEVEHKYYNSCNDYHCTQPPNGYLPAASYWAAGGQAQENYHHHYTANGAAAASFELTLNSYYTAPCELSDP